jgi:hypothetical protein
MAKTQTPKERGADIKHIVNVLICTARDGGYPDKTGPLYKKFCGMLERWEKESEKR